MIWCVEDDATIRDVGVYALKSTGFDARGFEEGTSFWKALQTEQPKLVILDVMQPILSVFVLDFAWRTNLMGQCRLNNPMIHSKSAQCFPAHPAAVAAHWSRSC